MHQYENIEIYIQSCLKSVIFQLKRNTNAFQIYEKFSVQLFVIKYFVILHTNDYKLYLSVFYHSVLFYFIKCQNVKCSISCSKLIHH